MAVTLPTEEQIWEIAEDLGLSLSREDVQSYIGLLGPTVEAYNAVGAMPDNLPEVKYPRPPGHRPSAEDNPHNAWCP